MNNIVNDFLHTLNYFELKVIFTQNKNKKNYIYPSLFFLLVFCFNIIILLSEFFLNFIFTILFILTISIIFTLIAILRQKLILKNFEKNNKILLNTSLIKNEFVDKIKNDLIFNQKFALFISSFFFLYQFLCILILSIFTQFSLKIFIYNLSYLSLILILIHICFTIFYFKKRRIKQTFKINKKSSFLLKNLFKTIFVFFLPILFFLNVILFLLTKNFIISIPLSILISIPILFPIKLLFDTYTKKRKINLLKYLNSSKKFFFSLKETFGKKNIITKNIIKPFVIFVLTFILLSLLQNLGIKISLTIKLIQSTLFSLLFIDPFFDLFKEQYNKNALNLTKFIFFLIFIFTFSSLIKIEINYKNNFISYFKDFVEPPVNFLNKIGESTKNFLNQLTLLFIILIPTIFILHYVIFLYLLKLIKILDKITDTKLKSELTSRKNSIIFGDTLSIFPLLIEIVFQILLLCFIGLEIKPFSKFLAFIFETFKVTEVFKFYFLTEKNIFSTFQILFYIYLLTILLRYTLELFTKMTSHLILFSDEIVYYENKIFNKTVLRIPVKKINYLIIRQNLLEKLLDIGNIYIETSNKNALIKISGVSSIKEKNTLLMEKIKSDI